MEINTASTTPPEQNALHLWNHRLARILRENLVIKGSAHKNKGGGMVPIQLTYKKAESAIGAAQHFEITKHRIIVDGLIERMNDLQGQFKTAKQWHFRKRGRLRWMMAGVQAAILVVVNTPPPVEETKQESKMHVNGSRH